MLGYGVVLARFCLAAVFLYSGVDKLWHWRSAVEEVEGYGLPWPRTCAALTVLTQLVGGVMLATGFGVWFGALLLAGFTVAATLLGHPFWLHRGDQFRREFTTTLEHLAIVGGFLLIALIDLAPQLAA